MAASAPRSTSPRRLGAALCALLAVSVAAAAPATGLSSAPAAPPRVVFFGDSVAEGIAFNADALAILRQGIDLQLELAQCRRLEQASCYGEGGVRPPTVIDRLQSGIDAGSVAIVAVGYNDYESYYPGDIEDVLAALRKAGVTRVLWPTLRATAHQYLSMNDAIRAAAERHPELTVVDWNAYSRNHPDWFGPDGLHLGADGALAMATLLHQALVDLGIPQLPAPPPAPAPTPPAATTTAAAAAAAAPIPLALDTRLPVAHRRVQYVVALHASGGTPPYRWSHVGPLPLGIALRADGRLSGLPPRAGAFRVGLRVVDRAGAVATRVLSLRVRG
jgi:hypothetical protein